MVLVADRSSKKSKKERDEEELRQSIAARLKAKSTDAGTTEFDESVEGWNPADEARQAKRVDSWRSSQAQQSEMRGSETAGSHSASEFRPYQDPDKSRSNHYATNSNRRTR